MVIDDFVIIFSFSFFFFFLLSRIHVGELRKFSWLIQFEKYVSGGAHCIVLLISLWVFWMQKMGLGSISLMHMHNSIIKKKRKKKKRGRTLLYEILVNISQCVLYC